MLDGSLRTIWAVHNSRAAVSPKMLKHGDRSGEGSKENWRGKKQVNRLMSELKGFLYLIVLMPLVIRQ